MTSLEAPLVGSLPISDPPTDRHRPPDGFVAASPWRLAGSPSSWMLSASGRSAAVVMSRSGSCAVSVEGRTPIVLDPRLSLFVPAGQSFRMAPVTRQQAEGRAIRLSRELTEDFAIPESRKGREIPFIAEIPDLLAILGALHKLKANGGDRKARLEVVASIRAALVNSPPGSLSDDSRSVRPARRTRTLAVDRFSQSLTLAAIGRSLGLSPYYVCHVFRRHFGISIHQFLLDLRVRATLDLIASGSTNFGELSDTLGFSSPSHFASAIKTRVGLTPSDLARLIGPPEPAP